MEKGITRPNGSKKYIGILLMLTCALLWSANGLCIKLTPWNSMVLAGWARLRGGDNAVYRHEGAEDENKHKRPHRADRHMRMRDRLSLHNSKPPYNGGERD